MRNLILISVTVMGLVILSVNAKAVDTSGGVCKADADKYCKDIEPGGGRLIKCLADNESKLEPACKEQTKKMHGYQPCMADAERLCKGIKPGDGKLRACMKEHKDELSEACKKFVEKKKDDRRANQKK